MIPKLIGTDLDGTLVRSDHTVSPRSHKVLKELSDKGVVIVGITGRGPRLLQLCQLDLPSADFLVMGQGGFIYRLDGDGEPETVVETYILGERIAEAVELVERAVGPVSVMVEGAPEHEALLVGEPFPGWPWQVKILEQPRQQALSGRVVKAFIRSDEIPAPQLLVLARNLVPPELASLTDAGIGNVEICPPGINKDVGLARVATSLGISPAETLVFGDAENDLTMIKWAGRSVAVANAHAHIKEAVDELTDSNDEDGVAVYLERLFGL